jgi:UDP-N-acetylmuramyl pentapeptide phosphotransferase/UDP-N-acetylglucosamine-1-phosphate transferase
MTFSFIGFAVSLLITLALLRSSHNSVKFFINLSRRNQWLRNGSLLGFGRAGGIGVAAGILASLLLRLLDDTAVAWFGIFLLGSATPVFLAGLTEDFTQRVGIILRLVAAIISTLLAGALLNAWISRVDVLWLDSALTIPLVSIAFTCLAVVGVTNAFNIIDGFNGLAAGVANLVLLGIAYVAFKVGDVYIVAAALTAIGAISGFMILNFPRGLIYLGDGGAYLVGFWIAELSVLLVARNPQVSAWFPALLCSYPIFETLFTVYRRLIIRRTHPGLPDVAHLHHLIYKRLIRWAVGTNLPSRRNQRNSLTSTYLWIITSVGVVPAVVFWRSTLALQLCCACFAAAYIFGYRRIVKFHAPNWWILRKNKNREEH